MTANSLAVAATSKLNMQPWPARVRLEEQQGAHQPSSQVEKHSFLNTPDTSVSCTTISACRLSRPILREQDETLLV